MIDIVDNFATQSKAVHVSGPNYGRGGHMGNRRSGLGDVSTLGSGRCPRPLLDLPTCGAAKVFARSPTRSKAARIILALLDYTYTNREIQVLATQIPVTKRLLQY